MNNSQKLIEAIGHIDDDFINEYQTYQPKNRIKRYKVVGIPAACAVLALLTGLAANHSSELPAPPNISNAGIVPASPYPFDYNETEESVMPLESQVPDTAVSDSASPAAENDAAMAQPGSYQPPVRPTAGNKSTTVPAGGEVLSKPPAENDTAMAQPDTYQSLVRPNVGNRSTPAPAENNAAMAQPGSYQPPVQPTASDRSTPAPAGSEAPSKPPAGSEAPSKPPADDEAPQKQLAPIDKVKPHDNSLNWNQITACAEPYQELFLPIVPSAPDDIQGPDSIDSDDNSILHNSASKDDSDTFTEVEDVILSGWYWTAHSEFTSMYARNQFFSVGDKESILASRLYSGKQSVIYMVQEKTIAASLKEANKLHHAQVFYNLPILSYMNGEPVYLVENAAGEAYARIYKDHILITLWEKGFDKDTLIRFIQNLRKSG